MYTRLDAKSDGLHLGWLNPTRCVLFDLDQTLIDTLDLTVESYRNVVKEYLSEDVSRKELLTLDLAAPALTVLEDLLSQRQISSAELAHNMRERFRLFLERDHDRYARLFDDVTMVLDTLKSRKYILGMVTSKPRTLARMSMVRFSLDAFFDVAVFQEDTEAHKPDPAPILEAIHRLCDTKRCMFHIREFLYAGDAAADIEAGGKAGVLTAAAVWGLLGLESEWRCLKLRAIMNQRPTYVLTSVTDLLDICPSSQSAAIRRANHRDTPPDQLTAP